MLQPRAHSDTHRRRSALFSRVRLFKNSISGSTCRAALSDSFRRDENTSTALAWGCLPFRLRGLMRGESFWYDRYLLFTRRWAAALDPPLLRGCAPRTSAKHVETFSCSGATPYNNKPVLQRLTTSAGSPQTGRTVVAALLMLPTRLQPAGKRAESRRRKQSR